MSSRAARVLAFPGIDLERLTELRARASDAFLREDFTAYRDACTTIRQLIGGQDVSETGARSYRKRRADRQLEPLAQGTRDQLNEM
jgi:hypothetical protein